MTCPKLGLTKTGQSSVWFTLKVIKEVLVLDNSMLW